MTPSPQENSPSYSLNERSISPFSLKIYKYIQKKNKRRMVTCDTLFENKSFKTTEKISKALHELVAEGLITINSTLNRGRFENELIPKDGYIPHPTLRGTSKVAPVKGILRTDSDDSDEELKPKRKYQRRTVRRSLV